jgi:hypothetical protein
MRRKVDRASKLQPLSNLTSTGNARAACLLKAAGPRDLRVDYRPRRSCVDQGRNFKRFVQVNVLSVGQFEGLSRVANGNGDWASSA